MDSSYFTVRVAYESILVFLVVFGICKIAMPINEVPGPTVTVGEPTIVYYPPMDDVSNTGILLE